MSSDQATPEAQTSGLPPTPVSANSTEKKKGKAPAKPKAKTTGGVSKTEAMLWDIATHAEKIDFAGLYEKHGYANAKSMRDSFFKMKSRHFKTAEAKDEGDDGAVDDDDVEDESSPAPTPAKKSVKRKTVKEEDSAEKAVKKPRKTKAKAAVPATEEA